MMSLGGGLCHFLFFLMLMLVLVFFGEVFAASAGQQQQHHAERLQLLFPGQYRAGLRKLVEIAPSRNVTWNNGAAAFNKEHLSAKLSGSLAPSGLNLVNLYRFDQHTLYVISSAGQSCQRQQLSSSYSDPLEVARYTQYAGLANYEGHQVQQWKYQASGITISIFTTNEANPKPVRLYFLQAGAGVLVEYASFSPGSSPGDFQPPASCGKNTASSLPANGASDASDSSSMGDPFSIIADFIAAHP